MIEASATTTDNVSANGQQQGNEPSLFTSDPFPARLFEDRRFLSVLDYALLLLLSVGALSSYLPAVS